MAIISLYSLCRFIIGLSCGISSVSVIFLVLFFGVHNEILCRIHVHFRPVWIIGSVCLAGLVSGCVFANEGHWVFRDRFGDGGEKGR